MLCLSPNKHDLKDIIVNNSYHIWNTKTGQYKKSIKYNPTTMWYLFYIWGSMDGYYKGESKY